MYVYQHQRKKPFFFQNEIETCVTFHMKEKKIQNILILHRNDKFYLKVYVEQNHILLLNHIYLHIFYFKASKKVSKGINNGL